MCAGGLGLERRVRLLAVRFEWVVMSQNASHEYGNNYLQALRWRAVRGGFPRALYSWATLQSWSAFR
jgi:hypothetical protein